MCNLAFTFIGMFTVDKLGRKALMLLGAGGLAGIYAVVGTLYFLHIQGLPLLIMVVTAIACYAMSLAPVTWVVLSEIFRTGCGEPYVGCDIFLMGRMFHPDLYVSAFKPVA